ncbi:MAG TPA: Gfo/Idh/MocA family oxidoreductase [Tepidisphaeraceae bacterium]|nr:Gfo/Idh/MocA family oxidoreductase [Tepidisphaeraceae bacterium]
MPTRRDFLASAATVLATGVAAQMLGQHGSQAQAAPSPQPTTQPTSDNQKKLGWAIVGIGKLTDGQILPALAICKQSRLTAFVSGHPAKVPPILKKYNLDPNSVHVYNYDNYDTIANDPSIDIVYIVLPNGMHAEYTDRALKAGKHVLCEKPMANSTDECRQMIETARITGKKLMIAYRVHHELYNQKAIELCQNGKLGKPRLIITDHTFHLGDVNAWRLNKKLAGGGALVDVGIYGINATRYLSREEPISVTAQITETPMDPRFVEVEESTAWTLKFPSGLLANCTASYNAKGTNRCRIILEDGMIDMEPATAYMGNTLRDPKPIDLPHVNQFQVMMDYFSDCVANNKTPDTPGEEGLQDMRIIEAIYEAGRTGRVVLL